MSQHDQRTQHGPSPASILILAAASLAALVTMFWIIDAPQLDDRDIGGAVLALVLAFGLFSEMFGRLIERRAVIIRKRRQRDAARARQEYEIYQRAASTGTWEGPSGELMTLRYDPETGLFYAHGWFGDFFQVPRERAWFDRRTLIETVTELEASGELRPRQDEGTFNVRARLSLPDARTERIAVPLDRPMPAPGFLSEAEREVWNAENADATEIIRLSREASI